MVVRAGVRGRAAGEGRARRGGGRLRGRGVALHFAPMKAPDASSPHRLTLAHLPRARGGVAVQSGVRSGTAKTADKQHKQLMDYLKS